ncbi:nucleotidyltransferase domain-containing protein [Candidatus Pacearchaeota archaeon]|nr:nucleotidyltransferase domain-containing protein [Candidatus Pacearchaeota archaeon]
MLNIFYNLKPFFEDCYRRISVREYSRIIKISPPTASKLLSNYNKEGLLSIEKDRNYISYYANKNSRDFIDLSRMYWRANLRDLINYLDKKLTTPAIILFGSLAKAETKINSDIDLCILAHKKELNLNNFERKFKRKIQMFFFNSIKEITNPELKNSILNGYILEGRIKL